MSDAFEIRPNRSGPFCFSCSLWAHYEDSELTREGEEKRRTRMKVGKLEDHVDSVTVWTKSSHTALFTSIFVHMDLKSMRRRTRNKEHSLRGRPGGGPWTTLLTKKETWEKSLKHEIYSAHCGASRFGRIVGP